MELNKILIGMTLSIILVMGFVLFLADGVDKYNPSTIPADYNASFQRINNNFAALTNISINANNQTNLEGAGDTNPLSDFLGFFFGQGYRAVQVFIGGIYLLNDMVYVAVDQTIGSTAMGTVVTGALLTIIIIVIVSLLLHFIIKSDRI